MHIYVVYVQIMKLERGSWWQEEVLSDGVKEDSGTYMMWRQRGEVWAWGAVEEDLLELAMMTHMHGMS